MDNDKSKQVRSDLAELVIVVVACQIPLFVLAAEIDSDEWAKSGTGTVLGIAVGAGIAMYKVWKGKS